jgi:ribosomal protein S27AE
VSHPNCQRCGGEPILLDEEEHGYQVVCSRCHLPTAWYGGPNTAWYAWDLKVVDYSRAKCFTTRAEDAGLTGLSFAIGA